MKVVTEKYQNYKNRAEKDQLILSTSYLNNSKITIFDVDKQTVSLLGQSSSIPNLNFCMGCTEQKNCLPLHESLPADMGSIGGTYPDV
jgi:hypothetical protein